MIKSNKSHELTLGTSDKRTAILADAISHMGEFRSEGFMDDNSFIHIHNILRDCLETENYLSVVQYSDQRENDNEYHIIVAEFPEKADGKIFRVSFNTENEEYSLLTEEEAIFNAIQKTVEKKEIN